MPKSLFYEKKELFERGVSEVRTQLAGRDITTITVKECKVLYQKYEELASFARELCGLSHTTFLKEQYSAYAGRLGERATMLKLLSEGKTPKATIEEKRGQMLEEFEKRTADIKKRLRSRTLEELNATECEALSKKYEKLALLAKSIASLSKIEAEELKYREFYEKLMCRVAELNAMFRKKSKKGKGQEETKAKKGDKKSGPEMAPSASTPKEPPKKEPTKEERILTLQRECEQLSRAYESLIRGYHELETIAISDGEKEEFAYFVHCFTESAEFFEAVRKKEIQPLSPEEILIETKKC